MNAGLTKNSTLKITKRTRTHVDPPEAIAFRVIREYINIIYVTID